ncbi:MAG: hypothetical protein IKS05_07055 [Oscillospiraceae bacterium]|nr:hypothetical protein [Oscillospiraceae bacterium]
MKVRITDLMDLYQDPKSPFGEEGMAASGQKEAIEVKQSKHAFGWREGLSLAAALAVVVLAGFGVKKLLQRSSGPAGPANSTTVMSSPEPSQNESTDPTGGTEYDLAQLQALNPYVSYFAEQNILHRAEDFSTEYDVVSFLHLWFKLHDREAIVYADVDAEKPEFSGSFETLTLEQMNHAADQLLGMQLSPAEGTDYTVLRGDNYAQHEHYAGGKFFFPAADGDQYPRFALCTQASSFDGGQPNSVGVSFKVYEPTEKYPGEPDREELQKLYIDVASAMESRGELRLCQIGTATLQKTESGYRMLDYNAQDMEEGSQATEPERHLNRMLSAVIRAGITDSAAELQSPEELLRFAHLYALLNRPELLTHAEREGSSWDLLTTQDLNDILALVDQGMALPAEGTEYPAAEVRYRDGSFWFPVSWLDSLLPRIAVCDNRALDITGSGEEAVEFLLVDLASVDPQYTGIDPENPPAMSFDQFSKLIEKLAAQGQMLAFQRGKAQVRWEEGVPVLLSLKVDLADATMFIQDSPLRSEQTDPDGVASVRELLLRKDGSFSYREGEPNSEYSFWAAGTWRSLWGGRIRLDYCPTGELGNPLTGGESSAVYSVHSDNQGFRMTLEEGDGLGRDQTGWSVTYALKAEETEEWPNPQPSDSDQLLADLSEYLDSADKDWVWLHRALSCGTFTSQEEGERLLAALPEELPRINLSYRALRPLGNDEYQLEYGRLDEGQDKEIIWTAQFRWTDKEFTLLSNHVAVWNE